LKVIAVVNQKGGVAKTTTVAQLAWGLIDKGKKVLVIDCDPQGNLSQSVGANINRNTKTIYDWIGCNKQRTSSFEKTVQKLKSGIDIIPSTQEFTAAEIDLLKNYSREYFLKRAIEDIPREYDYILLDSPPNLGMITINVLVASDEILIPAKPEKLSHDGCNKKLRINGFLITMIDNRRNSLDLIDLLADYANATKSKLYQSRIRNSAAVSKAPEYCMSVYELDPKSIGAEDYRAFVSEFLGEVNE